MRITTTQKDIESLGKKYVRLVITTDSPTQHRFVEKPDGTLEYRMGAGKWNQVTPRKFITLVRSIVQAAKHHKIAHLAIQLSHSPFPKLNIYDESWVVSTITENLNLAAYEFTEYKSKKLEKVESLKEILICGGLNKKAQEGFARGVIIGNAANTARDIANHTAEDMTPVKLEAAAKNALRGTSATVTSLGEKALKRENMNLLLAVGGGSHHETKLIVVEYYGAGKPAKKSTNKKKQPLILVGKGITFDTGGLNVKPSGHMHDMHLDMSGGAAVIGALQAAAKLKLKKNIIGLVPAAENAVSRHAMRPGDIVTAKNGKTVEILHTDAEGRLVLADALTYAERFNPRTILDIATLTGAALSALGQHASAILTKNEKLQATLKELGEESGDYVWPLPLWDEYQQYLKSNRADLTNIHSQFGRFGGTIEGGAFLINFVPKNIPWAHIDIAPRMEAIPSDKLTKGATGEPVRLLVKALERL